ncbi:hypothetical protein [Actinocrispum wychmicini]|uniref:DUF4367 domain-containing protein n=1 Tax=Actinocrispum wychmicini TaxID=1213861 RepID=A0A4R2K755_9PSEU|nr:hypothetical protein [Actinocrispum wychmicini]TCO62185.1 hypothetical protein EV192_102322 [Actinocrispum wychmicini]
MNVEKLIADTFTAHEDAVPDSDSVLAAARQRIDRGSVGLSRPLAVAGGATVLTLAAAAVVVLNRPADERQVAGPAAEVQSTKAAAEPAVTSLQMPFSLGWLPPGAVTYLAHRINVGATTSSPDASPLYGGEYMLTVKANGQVLEVDVQHFRMMPVDQAAFKSGPGKAVTVNGQRGVESSVSSGPGGYELYVTHRDGGSMYVNVSAAPGSKAPAQQLVDAGRRIAENIQFPGATTVKPAYGLRDLPNGTRICAFDVEQGGVGPSAAGSSAAHTSYALGTCATMPPINVTTAVTKPPAGTPGQPVQGHATRLADEKGYQSLWVLDAVDGAPVIIAGRVPQTDLYDIADRLVLPH